MNSLNTLFFPGTDIFSIRQYPVYLLFQNIHLIRPVEDLPDASGAECQDSFINSGFCQVHTPCPLGRNRARFLQLVQDIQNRKDDYAAQLNSLLLAAKSRGPAEDSDSERAIINSLLAPAAIHDDSIAIEKEEKLWQARLVLSIGEILDLEEEEIARDLAIVEDDQAGLFKALHGDEDGSEDDSPFAELSQLERKLGAANAGNIKKRFQSWKTLFLEGDAEQYEVFLTTSQDGGDFLLELFEKTSSQPPHLATTLELPGLIGWNNTEAHKTATAFCHDNVELLSTIQSVFTKLLQQDIPGNSLLPPLFPQDTLLRWQHKLESTFPSQQFGRVAVNCYLLPGISCSALLGKESFQTSNVKNGLLVVVD